MKFLDMKLTLIKQLKLSFDAYDFTTRQELQQKDDEVIALRSTLHGRKAFLEQLAKGNDRDQETAKLELKYNEERVFDL